MKLPDIYINPEALDIPAQCKECPTLHAINVDYLKLN